MNNNEYKFDKISDLIAEIDKVIEDLTNKKKEILSKIDIKTIKLAHPEDKGMYTTRNGKEYKMISVPEEENKNTSFSTTVNQYTYDLLNKIVQKYGLNVSSFLRNKYFLNFVDKDYYKDNYIKDYIKINEAIGDKLQSKDSNDRKSIALALKSFDTDRLEKAAKFLEISPREVVKHLINQVIYDELINHKIKSDYVPLDNNITYVKCGKSSNVNAYGYDAKNKRLYIEFKSGARYQYSDVPKEIYENLLKAESKGQFVNDVIKVKLKKYKRFQ